jgi:hypothetical protein
MGTVPELRTLSRFPFTTLRAAAIGMRVRRKRQVKTNSPPTAALPRTENGGAGLPRLSGSLHVKDGRPVRVTGSSWQQWDSSVLPRMVPHAPGSYGLAAFALQGR